MKVTVNSCPVVVVVADSTGSPPCGCSSSQGGGATRTAAEAASRTSRTAVPSRVYSHAGAVAAPRVVDRVIVVRRAAVTFSGAQSTQSPVPAARSCANASSAEITGTGCLVPSAQTRLPADVGGAGSATVASIRPAARLSL
ncbi:hypothetical protein Q2K19_05440 [Micromonospora soli]|uniref:hypothetical protein n=1 Tax=Micromonospora sp. NBRC 110009 TaxID=3061627 RepID=UPI002672AAE9|nr:hypothetical protein [Micromonospora sp. NBRC 110009]WKT99933.1 hypothetical protein Q2K19_05440 [Micromonospora sp. NBRC 110009]